MALHVNPNQAAPEQPVPTQQQAQQQQQTQQQQTQGQGYQQQYNPQTSVVEGISNQFRRSGRVDGGDNRSAEALQIVQRLKKEAVENQDLEENFQILRFDRDANRVGWSSLLILKTAKFNGKLSGFVRTLMMPNSQIKLPNRKVQYNNAGYGGHIETLEVEVKPQDVFTAKYWDRIAQFVRNNVGDQSMTVFSVGGYVVPGEFDLKEEHALKQLLIRSVNLCDDMIARQGGEAPFSVNMIKDSNEVISASLDFSGNSQQDQLGNPIRTDVLISMKRGRRDNIQENEFYESDSAINQASLIVDLEYNPQPQAMFGQVQQQVPPFTPTVIITDRRNAPWIKATTLELDLLNISNTLRVANEQAWARAFSPVVGKVRDLRDIGALGYMGPTPAKVDTKTETFTQQHFADMMFAFVKPHPVFMIDLDTMGDNGFIDSIWIDLMAGPNQAKAKQVFIQAVNNLIGQDFKQFFDYTTEAIIQPYGATINKGYWFDGDEKRDRRDLDVLGALNASEGNMQEFMSWYATRCNTSTQADLRNKQYLGYERQYLGNNVTDTGRAVRAIFNPKFIQGLDAGIAAAGLQVLMDNVAMNFGAQRFQGNMAINNFAVTGNAHVASAFGAVNSGGGYQPVGVGLGSFYG